MEIFLNERVFPCLMSSREEKRLRKLIEKESKDKFKNFFEKLEITPEDLTHFQQRKGVKYEVVSYADSGYSSNSDKIIKSYLPGTLPSNSTAIFWSNKIPLLKHPYEVKKFFFDKGIDAIINHQLGGKISAYSVINSGLAVRKVKDKDQTSNKKND